MYTKKLSASKLYYRIEIKNSFFSKKNDLPCESKGLHNPAIAACTKKGLMSNISYTERNTKTNSQ
jgi:hypothetical protein